MAAAYLTREEYAARVGVDLEEAPTDMELRIASDRIDDAGPFYGFRADFDQEREFPRHDWAVTPRVPDSILDAVCLLAKAEADGEDEAGIKSESVLDASVTYATQATPKHLTRVAVLLRPHQRTNGRML